MSSRGVRFDRSSAQRIARAVRRVEGSPKQVFGGRAVRGQILSAPMHWGTLDAQLNQSDTTGVTVSLTLGGDVDNVLPPPTMKAGTHIDSGSSVLIALIDGAWYVILAPC